MMTSTTKRGEAGRVALNHRYQSFTAWRQNKSIHLVQKKKKKLDEEKRSQDKGMVCYHDVGGGGANAESLASVCVCFRKVLGITFVREGVLLGRCLSFLLYPHSDGAAGPS